MARCLFFVLMRASAALASFAKVVYLTANAVNTVAGCMYVVADELRALSDLAADLGQYVGQEPLG